MDAAFTVPADTILSTIIVLFTGEFLPKSLFKSNPNRLLAIFAIPAFLCYVVLWPISRFSTWLSRIFLRIFGIKLEKENADDAFTKVDLDYLVQTSINNAENEEDIEDEVKIFQNALDFADTKVRDCMVPRTEIRAVEDNCSLDELMTVFVESGKSKIIVYHDDIDHITGYIHSSEMFRAPKEWRDNIQKMPYVPETMTARKLMQTFLQKKKSLAVVIDEFGGTSGIVSLEDIVEEIFGEIEDEHDSSNYIAKQLPDGEYMLSARLEIDKINEMFNLELPESEEYMTLGGLILHYYQSFPKLNEVVTIGRFEFKIIKNTMTKIELVRLKVNE
jgi:CBS domain containing-hemolysin-like protein